MLHMAQLMLKYPGLTSGLGVLDFYKTSAGGQKVLLMGYQGSALPKRLETLRNLVSIGRRDLLIPCSR